MSPIQWLLLALGAVVALAVAFYWLVARLERRRYRHFAPDGTIAAAPAPAAGAELVVTPLPSGAPRALPAGRLNWVGRGLRLTVQSFALNDPMAYFWSGPAPRGSPADQEPSAVQAGLAATAGPVALPDEPRYAKLSPAQRGTYLAWLAAGCPSDSTGGVGQLLLFVYGLERRALSDGADVAAVFDEVLRLRDLVSDAETAGRRFDRASRAFLWFLAVRHARTLPPDRVRACVRAAGVRDEDDLGAVASYFAQAAAPLPDWAAYAAAGRLVWSRRSNVPERVPEEFEALFLRRYRERFGAGLVVQPAKREGRFEYRPLNPSLDAAEVRAPSPWNQPAQFKPLGELWNECVDELRAFARRGRQGEDAGDLTLEAWEALPDEIRAGAEHPLSDEFVKLVERHTDAAGRTLVPAGELARLVGVAAPVKLTAPQARRVCEVAGDVGYCVEPDARLTAKGWRADETLAVFLRLTDRPADPRRYAEAAALLRFGIAVAAADGAVHDAEVAAVNRHIAGTFDLGDEEKHRLEALRERLVAAPPAKVAVDKALRDLPEAARRATVEMILVMVAVDGPATGEDRRRVQQWAAALGFSRDEVEGFLRSLPGPAAPAVRDEAQQEVRLDHAAIAAILKDTAEVARMLSAAMKTDEGEEEEAGEADVPAAPPAAAAPAVAAVETTADPTLPKRFAALYQELIARGEWPVDEAEALARRHGHMLGGAVEALNDWSFEKHGAQLFVEEGDRLVVESHLLG